MWLIGIGCAVIVMAGMAPSQNPPPPVSPPAEVNGWQRDATHHTYDYDTIFDYIDGIGEVYRAYNMRTVWAFRYHKPVEPSLTVDIFEMASPEDAYGVFSFERDGEEVRIGQGSDYAAGMLRFWKERFFTVITAERETPEVRQTVLQLGESIADAIPRTAPLPRLLRALPTEGMTSKVPLLFRHSMILNRHFFLANRDILNLSSQVEGVLATYSLGKARVRLVLVQYPVEADAAKAWETFTTAYLREVKRQGVVQTQRGKWTAAKRVGRVLAIVFDAPSRREALKMLEEVRIAREEVRQ